MIFIQDYLKTEENLMMSSNSTPLSSNYSKQSEVITFPSQAEEVTKEEIGKWVDLLMEMPEPGNSGSDFMNKGLEQFDDPLSCVAERILSEENLR
ncbi:MAG: hypothetical protein HOH60_01455 [Opitutae bacterium]|nr:hypothetical protein [Opitutae bacterium]